jgi:hypothetical protein
MHIHLVPMLQCNDSAAGQHQPAPPGASFPLSSQCMASMPKVSPNPYAIKGSMSAWWRCLAILQQSICGVFLCYTQLYISCTTPPVVSSGRVRGARPSVATYLLTPAHYSVWCLLA